MTPLQQEDLVRYSRHLSLDNFTNSSQLKINQSSILIVGIGGLGTITALYLANSGVGNIILNDFDSVDLSNLPRQILFNKEDINKNKADVAVEKLRAFNTAITLRSLNNKLSETELSKVISNVDIVLDCTDNLESRLLINKVCINYKKTLISGAAIRFEGHVAIFRNDISISSCYNCLYSQDDDNLGDCEGSGILASVAGMVGSIVANETIKVILKEESSIDNKLWIIDAKNNTNHLIKISKSKNCALCSI